MLALLCGSAWKSDAETLIRVSLVLPVVLYESDFNHIKSTRIYTGTHKRLSYTQDFPIQIPAILQTELQLDILVSVQEEVS